MSANKSQAYATALTENTISTALEMTGAMLMGPAVFWSALA
jgi:hypothetical protein